MKWYIRAAPFLCGLVFCGAVGWFHFIALLKVDLAPHFLLLDERTLRNMALIEKVQQHWPLIAAYGVLALGIVLFSIARRHPPWTTWLVLLALAAPWLLYLNVCATIFGKLLASVPE